MKRSDRRFPNCSAAESFVSLPIPIAVGNQPQVPYLFTVGDEIHPTSPLPEDNFKKLRAETVNG